MKYQHTAKGLASLGRNGDDLLMHVNKDELAGLQALLGPVTVNPETGLPEAFNWSSVLSSVGIGLLGALTGGAAAAAPAAAPGGRAERLGVRILRLPHRRRYSRACRSRPGAGSG